MTQRYRDIGHGHKYDSQREVCVLCGATRKQIDDGAVCKGGNDSDGPKYLGKVPGDPPPPNVSHKPRK
jgi:hypothetical protein